MVKLFYIWSLFFGFQFVASYENVSNLESRILNVLNKSQLKLYAYPSKYSNFRKAPRMYWKLELGLWGLIPKHMWTQNAEEADFFVFIHTLFGHWDRHSGQVTYINRELQPRLFEIYYKYPYYNRSNGRFVPYVFVLLFFVWCMMWLASCKMMWCFMQMMLSNCWLLFFFSPHTIDILIFKNIPYICVCLLFMWFLLIYIYDRDHLTVYVGDNGPDRDCLLTKSSIQSPLIKMMFDNMIKVNAAYFISACLCLSISSF